MGLMDLIDDLNDSFRFKDTVFYKETSDLQAKFDALTQLKNEIPYNHELEDELLIVKKGLDGEKEIAYQLKKSSIGMYVLHDVKFAYEDLTAQIDYIIITPVFTYFVECKNLFGNITVTEKGDFIREFTVNGRRVKKGIYSPLRQVEAQREVVRKIWEAESSRIQKINASRYFNYYRRVLVVAANADTILDTKKAPKDLKYKILRADALVRQIEYDIAHRDEDDAFDTQREMEQIAQKYIERSTPDTNNYYELYKAKFAQNQPSTERIANEDLKGRLLDLRTARSKEMKIPAYYVFTNDELEQILNKCPRTLEELKGILAPVKIKVHGESILEEINRYF